MVELSFLLDSSVKIFYQYLKKQTLLYQFLNNIHLFV